MSERSRAGLPLLDTNVLLRHLLQDHQQHSPRSTALLQEIEAGRLRVRLTEQVVFETAFTLERGYKVPKAAVRGHLLPLLELPNIVLPGKRRLHRVFDVYVRFNVSFVDAYHAVVIRDLKLDGVLSFDRDVDRLGVKRTEPPPVASRSSG